MVLKICSLIYNLEKCTSMFIFILFPRDFVRRSFPSRYSHRRSLLSLKWFRPSLPCPICPKLSYSNILLSRTYPLNLHFLSLCHSHCKNVCMKTASLFSTLFYEKCKMADFPYEHTDLVDISSTSSVLWYVVCVTSDATHPCLGGCANSSTKTKLQLWDVLMFKTLGAILQLLK